MELQLSGLKFSQGVKTTLDLNEDMQRRLVETLIKLPGVTLGEEFRRCNAAIDTVTACCNFQEGGLLYSHVGDCPREGRVRC